MTQEPITDLYNEFKLGKMCLKICTTLHISIAIIIFKRQMKQLIRIFNYLTFLKRQYQTITDMVRI